MLLSTSNNEFGKILIVTDSCPEITPLKGNSIRKFLGSFWTTETGIDDVRLAVPPLIVSETAAELNPPLTLA